MKFDKKTEKRVDQLLWRLSVIKMLCPWCFSKLFGSFLNEQGEELFTNFKSAWKTSKQVDRARLMLQCSYRLGKLSLLGVPVNPIMNKLISMGRKEMNETHHNRSKVVEQDSTTLIAFQNSSEGQQNNDEYITKGMNVSLENMKNEIIYANNKQLSFLMMHLENRVQSFFHETKEIIRDVHENVKEVQETMEDVKDETTELCIAHRYKNSFSTICFSFVVLFASFLLKELMTLSSLPDLVTNKLYEIIDLLRSLSKMILSELSNVASWMFPSFNPRLVMKRMIMVTILSTCVINALPYLFRRLLRLEFIGIIVFLITVYIQYTLGSFQRLAFSGIIFIVYFWSYSNLLYSKYYLYVVRFVSLITICYFFNNLYILVVRLCNYCVLLEII